MVVTKGLNEFECLGVTQPGLAAIAMVQFRAAKGFNRLEELLRRRLKVLMGLSVLV